MEVREEAAGIHTITMKDEACSKAKPGQFAMVWAPGAGEAPFSFSYMDGRELCGVRVKARGPTSTALCGLKAGDHVGIRGPYGNSFTPTAGSCLLVGGGVGSAPLLPLSRILVEEGAAVTLLLAAKSRGELILVDEAEAILSGVGHRVLVATDDGSYGFKGFAPQYVAGLLKGEVFNMIYGCGPEVMLKQIFTLAEEAGVPFQASLERYMRCGYGLCGSCVVGRYLVCVDGPIFDSKRLRELSHEFGRITRDTSGRLIPI